MFRAIAYIAAAIGLTSPGMPQQTRLAYAKMIRASARCTKTRCEIDPLTFVSFIWHESSWRAHAVGDGGRAIGLGQSWSWLYSASCKADADPLKKPSAACAAKRDALKNPAHAIRVIASSIRTARKVCRKKTKRSALFHRWLSLMGGRNHPRPQFRGVWCAQRRVTIGKGRKRRKVWRDVAWRRDRRFKEIREIIDCRRSLLSRKRCHREATRRSRSKRTAR